MAVKTRDASRRGGAGGREHRMFAVERHESPGHFAAGKPVGQSLDDLGLRRDGKRGDVFDPASRAPQAAAALPVSSFLTMRASPFRAAIPCSGQTSRQIMQPLQWS